MTDRLTTDQPSPTFEPLKLDPAVASMLNRILVMNQTIVDAFCRPVAYMVNTKQEPEQKQVAK